MGLLSYFVCTLNGALLDLIYVTGSPCNPSKQSGPDHSLYKRLVSTSQKTQNILKSCFFDNQKQIIGQKRELVALETVALLVWVLLSITWLCGWLATVAWRILSLRM
jgi:hypothetical protein